MKLIDPNKLDGCKLCTTDQFPRDRRVEGWNDCIEYLQKCCTHVPVVEVVQCKDCIFWKPRHIKLNDGSERECLPGEDLVDVDVGVNVGSKCMVDEGRGYGCDKSVFRKEDDFCSRGMRKIDAEVEG